MAAFRRLVVLILLSLLLSNTNAEKRDDMEGYIQDMKVIWNLCRGEYHGYKDLQAQWMHECTKAVVQKFFGDIKGLHKLVQEEL
jgi:hypothetical protein